MSIVKLRNRDGTWSDVRTIRGEPGPMPTEYVADASVSNSKLTLTKADGSKVEFAGGGGGGGSSDWNDITNKPEEFPPTSHTHEQREVNGLTTRLAEIIGLINDKVGSVTFNALSTVVNRLVGKESSWDAKSDFSGSYNDLADVPSTFTPSAHKHNIVDINSLSTILTDLRDNKADADDIPTKTSDLTNDSNYVVDANYHHTDNNYTTAEKNKLSGLSNYDVQIDGTSIVEGGVANIPPVDSSSARNGALGVVRTYYGFGIAIDSAKHLQTSPATQNDINNRNNTGWNATIYRPITSLNLDHAVKCAMTDGIGAEWSDEQKTNAQIRIGIVTLTQEEYDLIDAPSESTIYVIKG